MMSQTAADKILEKLLFPKTQEQLRWWTTFAGEWAEDDANADDPKLFEVQMALEGANMLLSALALKADGA